jgi:hypothetical protein
MNKGMSCQLFTPSLKLCWHNDEIVRCFSVYSGVGLWVMNWKWLMGMKMVGRVQVTPSNVYHGCSIQDFGFGDWKNIREVFGL